jgi:hypothetical protein
MTSSSRFRLKKDYYAAALMVIIGVAAAYAATGYQLGTLARMGLGFFPCAVGVLLALVGLAIALSARDDDGPPAKSGHGYGSGLPDLRGCACIVLGILAFLLLGEYGGRACRADNTDTYALMDLALGCAERLIEVVPL